MKKLLLLVLASSLCYASPERPPSVDQKTSDRIYALELTVQALVERVEWLTNQMAKVSSSKTPSSLYITEIDSFFGLIKLSNGTSYSCSYSTSQSIAHWLVGQPVKLAACNKSGYVKMVNLETDDSIEIRKSTY